MSIMQKFLTYIGLGPEHQYNDSEYDLSHDSHTREPALQMAGAVTQTFRPDMRSAIGYGGASDTMADTRVGSRAETIQPVMESVHAEPRVVFPQDFESAQKIADYFLTNHPVILNLEIQNSKLARRILDFASGICYALDGNIKRISSTVFLLTPRNSFLADEEVKAYLRDATNADYN